MQRISLSVKNIYNKIYPTLQSKTGFTLYAVLILIVMFSAYNILIASMGFYYDDWEGVLIQKQEFSFQQIWNYFLIDRPFSAIVHYLLNPIVGTKPASWRIAGMLVNWAAVLFVVKSLLRIWPKRIMEIGWIGLLLAVYPGITREFVIRTSMVHYASFLFFSISFWLMIKTYQEQKNNGVLRIVSMLLSLIQMLIIEYFSGLELIRGLVLLYLFKCQGLSTGKAVKKALLAWMPYLLIFVGFIVFRMTILPGIQQEGIAAKNSPWVITQFLQNPLANLIRQIEVIVQDTIYAVIYVWSQTIVPEDINLHARATLASWVIGAVVAILSSVYMIAWHQKAGPDEESEPFPLFILLLCIAAILLGGLPIWAVGRQAIIGTWSSRYLFGLVMGAVPFVVVFLSWAFGKQRRMVLNLVLGLLLMASISFQFRTAKKYALTWHYATDYYWQLKWRAPSLKPGTFILSPYTPFQYSADYEIAFAINVLYDTGNNNSQATYWWFDGPDDIFIFTKQKYPEKKNIDHKFRNISFISNMDHALPVVYKPSRGCLQVIDPVYTGEPFLSPEEVQLFPTIKSGLINTKEKPVPEDIFGKEPVRGWCYYFQSADLARSNQEWEQVSTYWETATLQGLSPVYGPEYIPFIEAFARLGNWKKSVELTKLASLATDEMEPFLCASWKRILLDTRESSEKENVAAEVLVFMNCAGIP